MPAAAVASFTPGTAGASVTSAGASGEILLAEARVSTIRHRPGRAKARVPVISIKRAGCPYLSGMASATRLAEVAQIYVPMSVNPTWVETRPWRCVLLLLFRRLGRRRRGGGRFRRLVKPLDLCALAQL